MWLSGHPRPLVVPIKILGWRHGFMNTREINPCLGIGLSAEKEPGAVGGVHQISGKGPFFTHERYALQTIGCHFGEAACRGLAAQ